MSRTRIQIRYVGGCVVCSTQLGSRTLMQPHGRKFLRLAAEYATDCPENVENVRELIRVLDQMTEDAKTEAELRNAGAESDPDNAAAQAEARRANTSLKRLQDIRRDFLQMLEKYSPNRKFD